jgi:predicted nucleic acid-binding Zn ribbon protein
LNMQNRNRPRKKKQPQRISSLVGALIKHWEEKAQKKEIIYKVIWSKVVGEHVAAHTRVAHIRGKQLVVLAESSAWMNELTFLKEKIKIKAKNLLSEYGISIEEVVFKLG